jgi:hypothetical protein
MLVAERQALHARNASHDQLESNRLELVNRQQKLAHTLIDRCLRRTDPELPLRGGCNCGAVRFEVTEPLVAASYCHCKRCQRRTGAAASPNAHPASDAFRIVAGEENLRMWKPGDGGEKWFCGECGSSVFGFNGSHADSIGIRMDVRRRPGIRPSVRQFVTYAAPWEPIPDDGLPRHTESRHKPS